MYKWIEKTITAGTLFLSVVALATDIQSKEACDAVGGHWGQFGFVKNRCNQPTRDHRKVCTDSNQCESACVADIPVDLSKFKQKAFCSGPQYKGRPCTSVADCGGTEVCVMEFAKIPGKGFCFGWTILGGTCLNHVKDGMISSLLCID